MNAERNLPSTCGAIASTSMPLPVEELARVLDAVDARRLDVDRRRSRPPRAWRGTRFPRARRRCSRPTAACSARTRRRNLAARDHVGDGEAAAGLQHAERFAQHAVLVGGEVDDAVRDDHVDRVVGQRDALDLRLSGTRRSPRRPCACSRWRAPASRRSCRGRRPCRWARRAAPRAARRCRRRSRGRAPSRRASVRRAPSGLPQPSEACTASSGHGALLAGVVQDRW